MLFAKEKMPDRANNQNVFGEICTTVLKISKSDDLVKPKTFGHAPMTSFGIRQNGMRKVSAGKDM